jgi:predicted RNase H-related nuclease YkuK (DUF458 family)
LKTTDGKAVSKYDAAVKVMDTVVPTADSAILTSPKTLELQFSEPVNFPTNSGVLTDVVQIDGINVYASNVDTTNLYTEGKVTLTLGTAVSVGSHKVKVANVNDFAGFPIASKEFSSDLVADTTAPSVTSVEGLSVNKIKVTFSENVDASSVSASNFVVKVPGKTDIVTSNPVRKSGNVYEFTLGTNLDLSATVDAKLAYKGIKDNYGNEVKTEQSFSFKAIDDTTVPTVAGYSVNSSNNVEVTFSESVKNVDASDFALYDKDGKLVTGGITSAVGKVIDGQTSDKTFVLSVASALSKSGSYTVKLISTNDIKDLSIRSNALAETSFGVTLADKAAPTIVSAKYDIDVQDTDLNLAGDQSYSVVTDSDFSDSKVTITFSEAMDVASLTNKANYLLGSTPLSDMSGVSLVATNGNKSVVITLNKDTGAPEQFASLKVLGVKDASGITLSSADLNAPLSGVTGYGAYSSTVAAATALDLTNVQLTAKNKIKVFAQTGYTFTAVDPNKVIAEVVGGSVLAAQVSGVSIAADGKSAELTLSTNLKANATTDDTLAVDLNLVAGAFSFEGAVKSGAASNSSALVDKVGASLVAADTDEDGLANVSDANNSITLTFDENVYATNGQLLSALVVKDKDGHRLSTDKYTVASDTDAGVGVPSDKTVVITILPAATDDYTGSFTISLPDNVTLKDLAGNSANSVATFTTESFTVESQATIDAATAVNALNTSITTAQTSVAVGTEGTVVGNKVVGSKATLNSAITAAQAVLNNAASTTTQLTAAKTTLDTAVTTYNAATVADITGVLVAPTTLALDVANAGASAVTAGTITGYVPGTGETLNVTSATPAVLTINAPTGLSVTALTAGSSVVTVQVIANGQVIKTGTVTVTVAP